MELFTSIMERAVAFWRNRRFFQFRKFHCPLNVHSEASKLFQLDSIVYFCHVIERNFDKKFIGLWACFVNDVMSKVVAG